MAEVDRWISRGIGGSHWQWLSKSGRIVNDADRGTSTSQGFRSRCHLRADPRSRVGPDGGIHRRRSGRSDGFRLPHGQGDGFADTTHRAVTYDDRLVGTIASFVSEGATEVTYWIDQSYWGQGIGPAPLRCYSMRCPCDPYVLVSPVTTSDRCGSYKRPGLGVLAPKRPTLLQGAQRSKRRSWNCPSYFPELSHNNDLRIGTRLGAA